MALTMEDVIRQYYDYKDVKIEHMYNLPKFVVLTRQQIKELREDIKGRTLLKENKMDLDFPFQVIGIDVIVRDQILIVETPEPELPEQLSFSFTVGT